MIHTLEMTWNRDGIWCDWGVGFSAHPVELTRSHFPHAHFGVPVADAKLPGN